jgi:pimeloyl-ACP methyl ester carboxylesterase
MKSLPFIIQKFVFETESEVKISAIGASQALAGSVPGYLVISSAPPNIEDAEESSPEIQAQAAAGIDEIAGHLYRMLESGQGRSPELVITVHGYNTSRSSVQNWYKDIFKYVNRHDPVISSQGNRVFVGYRWPSENVALSDLGEVGDAFRALPPLPRDLLLTGGLCALLLLLFELFAFSETLWGLLVGLGLAGLFLLGTLVLSLVVLRLVVYFRDRYRANNFGVLDLVELLRQIDRAMINCTVADMFPNLETEAQTAKAVEQARTYWQKRSHNKIKLSFIGHSMGGFVVTNVIRILSDVFDSRSISKQPPADVGDVFRLERLILASPDIPVLTIISSRANFLASSLRRFSESYLFSSEGDIALRIASTAANYIAFPSKTQSRGYRLGNVALQNKHQSGQDYGIINLPSLDREFPVNLPLGTAIAQSRDKALANLFLTYERFQQRGVVTVADLFEKQAQTNADRVTVADFFTYFDCTDYVDIQYDPQTNTCSAEPSGLLTRAKTKTALTPWDYFLLTLDYGLGKRDVHGGYFVGQFSQVLLYRLAFLGFSDYLATLNEEPQTALSQLHLACQQKQIQCFLSPFRYRVNVQGGSLEGTKQDLLEAIQVKDMDDLKPRPDAGDQ